MTVREGRRIDVRLDPERRERLEKVLEESGSSVSDLFRHWIDDAYERLEDRAFRARLAALTENPIDLPGPDLLSEELDHAHCPGVEFCNQPEFH
jgi:predicted DNA-binding protein